MLGRILIPIALVIVLVFGPFGVRFTTADSKREAEMQKTELVQERHENEQLRKELQDLKIRHEKLLDYIEENYSDTYQIENSPPPDIIRIPGTSDYNDTDDDETRIIERNNTNTVPNNSDNDDGDDDSDDGDSPPMVDVPDVPEAPEVPDIPLDRNSGDDLLDGTPLDDLL